MTDPLLPPKRKDPLKNTMMGHVAPASRSRAAKAMAARAAQGRFVLQSCATCATVTYPPRDRCPTCWGPLNWTDQPTGAVVLAETTIRATTDKFFRDHLPWRIGTVRLAAGPTAIVHLHGDVAVGEAVEMTMKLDRGGNPALFALPGKETPNMQDDPQLRVFTASPKHRRVLVTDGRTALGQETARALLKAGAQVVFLGNSDRLMRYNGQPEIEAVEGVEPVTLRVTDSRSVQELAAQLGGRIDIVVNTALHTRAGTVAFGGKLTDLQEAMDVEVSGLMRLAQAFGPALSARSGDGVNAAAAFVDVASIYGLTGNPAFAGMAASAAARMTLLHGFRHEMQQTGIRVMSVLTGPIDDGWHQSVPPPKVTPAQIARAIVQALEAGQEQTCVGDIAKNLMARWQDDPLLTVREENQ
jgi:NAD(P)-dependent dehydrogenase (short-subunit alcohol dehydrogenase family)/uncharacterized OB-fold protein